MLVNYGASPNNPPADLILVQSNYLTLPGSPSFRSTAVPPADDPGDPGDPGDPSVVKPEKGDPGELQPVCVGASEGDAVLLKLRYPYTAS
ncbi:hypothetical protein [Micromonospora parathelypteridis]|uniref:Uncharacterized protein n=1 Tax=Micromonospora parathelypteridis TaxID=1839617 RepID=A0A840W9N3_9ACTN|nr:hypothetical protein [Micromonospora parathelypteridis]MBB5480829.1 hypothetical protein [Micromonospora parathelypteridis]GGO21421.1 hypothetical protein GCM10011576_39710 [Micromonospora parathelypteridis]